MAVSFIGGGTRRKPTDLPQVTNKLYHIMLYTSPRSRFKLATSVVIGTAYIGNCNTITAMTALSMTGKVSYK